MEIMNIQHHKHEENQSSHEASTTSTSVAAASSPSPSSSPSHEFSFTISLQPSSATTSSASTTTNSTSSDNLRTNKTTSSSATTSSAFALDLSPADEIFFHGHLLPLHLLSHLPVSPRSSTNSLDSFTLPIKDLYEEPDGQNQLLDSKITSKSKSEIISRRIDEDFEDHHHHPHHMNIKKLNHVGYENITRGRRNSSNNKSKSFSLFGLSSKLRSKDHQNQVDQVIDHKDDHDGQKMKKNKVRLVDDLSHVLKRYMRMVRPLLSSLRKRGSNHMQFHRESYSYSGNLSLRRKPEFRGRRGEFSAPASMRTSPTNSGLLVASSTATLSSCSTSDSTMEELQAAIQAAIAHCKNSIAVEDKIKCHD